MTSAALTPPFSLTITRPDDWHLHVRDGEALHTVVPHTAAQFGRAIIMPNLRPPVTTAAQAVAYLQAQGRDVVNLDGGMLDWQAAGRPMVSDTGHPPQVV